MCRCWQSSPCSKPWLDSTQYKLLLLSLHHQTTYVGRKLSMQGTTNDNLATIASQVVVGL